MNNTNESIPTKPGIVEKFKQWVLDNKFEFAFGVLGVAIVALSIGLGEHSLASQMGHMSDVTIPGVPHKP